MAQMLSNSTVFSDCGDRDRNRYPHRGDRNIPSEGGRNPPAGSSQHHAAHIAPVIRNAIKSAGDTQIDGIAFSQGLGIGIRIGTLSQDGCNSSPPRIIALIDVLCVVGVSRIRRRFN
ncbi:MAG: hypothetical protein U9N46_08665 [Euryarchaeota archaeon]|nr:hypothetical protein [Euryarchaeota archaeon]